MLKVKRIASLSILFAVLSKLTGFLRDVFLSYFYGTGSITDAYMIAYTFPLLIVGLLGEAIGTGFVPLFTKIKEKAGEQASYIFANKLINIVLIFTSIIVLVFLLFKSYILKMIFPGLDKETFDLAIKFTQITIWCIYFLFLVDIFIGLAQIHHQFLRISFLSIPMNLFIILSFYLSEKFSTNMLPIGIVIGILSQTLLFPDQIKKIFKNFKIQIDIYDKNIKNIFLLSLPVLLGVSINQINGIVDMNMASSVQKGGISIINYSNRINTLFHGVVALTIANICYPILASYVNKKQFLQLNITVNKVLKVLTIVCLPATLLIMFYAKEIVTILYGRGSFNQDDIYHTSNVLRLYALSILPIAYREIIVRIFYSYGNTILPVYSSIIGVIINIILNIILSKYFGLPGLALASSIAAVISTIMLISLLKRKVKDINLVQFIKDFFKIIVLSIISLIPVVLLDDQFVLGNLFKMMLGSGLTIVVFLALLFFFRITDKNELTMKGIR